MSPREANPDQIQAMNELYYDKAFQFGVHKFYHKLKEDYPLLGITRKMVELWLSQQPTHQINQRQYNTEHINPIQSGKPFKIVQVDLIDYSNKPSGTFKYVLVLVDVFSKYVYARAFVNKTAVNTRNQFEHIYNDIIARDTWNKIEVVATDNGSEFQGAFHEFIVDNGMRHLYGIAGVPQTQAVVERTIKTIKTLLARKVKQLGGGWQKHLADTIRDYNNSYHSTIKDNPVNMLDVTNAQAISLFREQKIVKRQDREKKFAAVSKHNLDELQVGDMVRLKKQKGPLEKSYVDNWSTDLYRVIRIKRSRKMFILPRYYLEGADGSMLDRARLRADLLKVPV